MKLAVGIIAILWSLWLLYVWVRDYLPIKYDSYRRAVVDIIFGLSLVAAVCVAGIALISGGSWLWVIQVLIVNLLWMAMIDHGPGL